MIAAGARLSGLSYVTHFRIANVRFIFRRSTSPTSREGRAGVAPVFVSLRPMTCGRLLQPQGVRFVDRPQASACAR